VRAAAVGCFAGQPPGAYHARIDIAVTPAGRASRIDVSDAPDEASKKCLEQAADRSYPTSKDGKKLSIDVHVNG
jgi:hypothetical protein